MEGDGSILNFSMKEQPYLPKPINLKREEIKTKILQEWSERKVTDSVSTLSSLLSAFQQRMGSPRDCQLKNATIGKKLQRVKSSKENVSELENKLKQMKKDAKAWASRDRLKLQSQLQNIKAELSKAVDALRKLWKLRQQEINILLAEAEAREECDKEDSEDESDAESEGANANNSDKLFVIDDVSERRDDIDANDRDHEIVITPKADENKLAGEDNSNSDTVTGHDSSSIHDDPFWKSYLKRLIDTM